MKKSLIVTIGIVLILLVLGVWVYLLFYGTPNTSNDVFANLGFGSGEPVAVVEPAVNIPVEENVTQLDVNGDALKQLTTKPVAGFAFVGTSSGHIRYVERGTGYIFEIDTTTGGERRLSGTTIPRVVDAVFSRDGSSVALVIENGYTESIVAGTIIDSESAIEFVTLPQNAFDPSFKSANVIRFAVKTDGGTDGYEMDIRDSDPIRKFSIPFRDVIVLWGESTHIYNKTSQYFKGSIYRVGDALEVQTPGEYGFVGGITPTHYLGSAMKDDVLGSYALNRLTGEYSLLAITYIPEKCTAVTSDGNLLWCASPFESLGRNFLEEWYQGVRSSEDMLWLVDVSKGEAQLYSNLFKDASRLIDVDMIVADYLGTTPAFRNKIDNTLWLYDSLAE